MKISFDFDDTLTDLLVQSLAAELIAQGHEVYILTARFADSDETNGWGADWNDDLKEIAARLGIAPERWLFSGLGNKSTLAKKHGIELHLDDDGGWVSNVRQVCQAIQFNEHAPHDSIERFKALVDIL